MLTPVAMLTIKKPAHKFVDLGISLCLLVFIAGCTPPEKTALLNGSKLLEEGQPERALVELDKALDFIAKNEELKRNPKIMGHLHNQIGFAHQTLFRSSNGKTNHYSAANRAYLFTTTNLSTPPALKQRAHLNLAWLYLERYKWNENLPAFRENAKRAANEFEKLRVSVTDDKFNYWLEKGTAELHAGRFPSARESFKKVDAQNASALNGLGILAALDRRNEAATRYFEAAIDADNKNPKSHLHLAITMQALGQFQEALDAYKAYLSLDPELSSKISHVNSLVEGLEDYLKPVPKEEPRLEPVAEKKEQVVELKSDGENEKVDRDEIIENKNPVDVASVTEPVEVIENKTIEESVVSAKQGEATEIPEEESVEIVVIEPPIEEEEENIKSSDPKVLPVPAVQLREEPVGDNEKIEPLVKESKPAAVVNTDSIESDEVKKTKKKWTDKLNPARWFDKESKPEVVGNIDSIESDEVEKTKKNWTDGLNPVRWFDRGEKKKDNEQLTWKSQTPLPELPSKKPTAVASTNAIRVASLLPTTVAYPQYTYLHPALPEAGDRQVAKTYFEDGSKAQKIKEWQRAKAAYLEAVKADPAWFEARFKLGQASYYTGETSLALQSFENALSIDPNDGPARFNFAMSLVQGNYFAEAANELETFLQFDPNSIQGHLEVGKIYADKLRNIEKAAIHYKRAIGLNPEHPEAVNMRYWLIRNKAN